MSNYKALGIEKEMQEVFNGHDKTDLTILEESEYFYCPYITKRQDGEVYCNVSIISCSHKDWWYKNLIGWTFFCRISFGKYPNGQKYIREFEGIKITKTKSIIFKGFDPKDVIII